MNKKQRRVNRIKSLIIWTVVLIQLFLLTAVVVLSVCVFRLNTKIDELSAYNNAESAVVPEEPIEVSKAQTTIVRSNYANEPVTEEGTIAVISATESLAQAESIPVVYLTFDDGPSPNSNKILDILDDYGIKATFFVVGREDDTSAQIYRRIVDEGHTLGMHSYTHIYSKLYASEDSFSSDLNRIHDLLLDRTGVDCKLYRFPGGSSNHVSNVDVHKLINILNDRDIRYFDWNVANRDATGVTYTADELVENVMTNVVEYKTTVVLMHDVSGKEATVESLPKLIESLQAIGAVILPITDSTPLIQHDL